MAAAASSSEVECKVPSPSDSFYCISEAEIEEVSKSMALEASYGPSSLSGSSLVDLKELGNGWVAADEQSTRTILALGRDLASDPRVQAAVLERVRDASALTSQSKLLDELKLVLVAREVVADSTDTTAGTTPRLTPSQSAENLSAQAEAAGVQQSAEPACDDEPSLGAAFLEAALMIASVLILTVVAKRVNPKACAVAAAALAGAWSAIFANSAGRKARKAV
jgi:hypothetical protein